MRCCIKVSNEGIILDFFFLKTVKRCVDVWDVCLLYWCLWLFKTFWYTPWLLWIVSKSCIYNVLFILTRLRNERKYTNMFPDCNKEVELDFAFSQRTTIWLLAVVCWKATLCLNWVISFYFCREFGQWTLYRCIGSYVRI